jgi:hypothetical protein
MLRETAREAKSPVGLRLMSAKKWDATRAELEAAKRSREEAAVTALRLREAWMFGGSRQQKLREAHKQSLQRGETKALKALKHDDDRDESQAKADAEMMLLRARSAAVCTLLKEARKPTLTPAAVVPAYEWGATSSGALWSKPRAVGLRKSASSGEGAHLPPLRRDTSRGAKISAKNINANYVVARTAALPPMVKLVHGETSIQDQLKAILSEHKVRLIDLFREWDEDGNGGLDKKEMRHALATLGYDAPRAEVDAFFDSIDVDTDGWIEFDELKRALNIR